MARTARKKEAEALDGKLRQVIDPAIAQALSHPLRSHILVTLGDRVASPNEIARELGLAARDLDYHVKVLVEFGMIRLAGTKKRRGVKEHFYELARPLLYFDDRRWQAIPSEVRTHLSGSLLRLSIEDALAALRAGTFNARDSHQSRTPMILDEQGWNQVTEVMRKALDEVLGVRRECQRRRQAGNGEGIAVEVVMMGFETAPSESRVAA
ncbi:MAG TPA: helix-turn-helix domain-containing protein [Solirubrobacterales bacterium]|nr:helix-turn-helix domain-containing protein [Solirubrobacterales bacterium]